MTRRSIFSYFLTVVLGLSTAFALSAAAANSASVLAPQEPSGEVTVTGVVRVDRKEIRSGFNLSSGATATTAQGSSAVVSVGKLGRVEVTESSTANISWDGGGYKVALSAGRVRVSSSSGFTGRVSTKNGEAVSDDSGDSEFYVDTICGYTFVSVKTGRVELRAGSTVKQIAAGSQDTAGQTRPDRCHDVRP